MINYSKQSGQPSDVPQPRRRLWQFGLRTLLLLMAAIAAWTAYLVNLRRAATLETRLEAMRPTARELVISDPSRIAIVKLEELWYDENAWQVYLPPGEYRLRLATRGIEAEGFAAAVQEAALTTGTHRLELTQVRDGNVWRVMVMMDHAELLTVQEPAEWDPGFGSTGGGNSALD